MACRSSSSWIGSPVSAQEQTTSVGARSSFEADSGPAASLRRSSASGPITRKRQGLVRLWLGAQRARSSISSSVPAVDRLGPVGLVGPARADRLLDFHSGER